MQIGDMTKTELVAQLLSSREAREQFLVRTTQGQPSKHTERAEAILLAYANKVAHDIAAGATLQAAAQRRAVAFLQQLRSHSGPPGRTHTAMAEHLLPCRLPDMSAGQWLQVAPAPVWARPAPPPDARLHRILAGWDLARLGPLPPHAVVCPERAEGRVVTWRRDSQQRSDAPPPMRLLRALVHTDPIPTLTASQADHYWLVALGRWMSPAEVMTAFGVPPESPIRSLVGRHPMDTVIMRPGELTACLGRAVHAESAEQALRLLLSRVALPIPTHYASLCSGIDMFATALDAVLGSAAWQYTLAAECDRQIAAALACAWSPRGLTPAAVAADAATAPLTAADLCFWSPPCRTFSRRNHNRSAARVGDAVGDMLDMLAPVRAARPLALVVENVDEIDARAEVTAALMTLPGYEMVRLSMGPRAMRRQRSWWLVWRVA